ncbi:MAG: ABC transporter permease [Eubacteriales bacterium]
MKKENKLIKFIKENHRLCLGLFFLFTVIFACTFAFLFTSHDPMTRYENMYHTPPSSEHPLGTTRLGRDVLAQTLYGGRKSLSVGLFAAAIATTLSMTVGISAGYLGGLYDSVISMITNVMMVIPTIVLLLLIAAMLDGVSPALICIIIGLTSWPWNARILRAQTMSIRNRDFVRSAETLGESKLRILFIEIMPNMLSIISSSFVGTLIYAITAHATLEFIGFGDPLSVTWGTILYNARNTGSFQSGYYWEVAGAITCLVLIGMGLTLINFAIDEISNPKLRAQRIMKNYYRAQKEQRKQNKKVGAGS